MKLPTYAIIESEGVYSLLKILKYGTNVLHKEILATDSIKELNEYIINEDIAVHSISSGNVKGITGAENDLPPVKKRKKLFRRWSL